MHAQDTQGAQPRGVPPSAISPKQPHRLCFLRSRPGPDSWPSCSKGTGSQARGLTWSPCPPPSQQGEGSSPQPSSASRTETSPPASGCTTHRAHSPPCPLQWAEGQHRSGQGDGRARGGACSSSPVPGGGDDPPQRVMQVTAGPVPCSGSLAQMCSHWERPSSTLPCLPPVSPLLQEPSLATVYRWGSPHLPGPTHRSGRLHKGQAWRPRTRPAAVGRLWPH